MDCTADTRKLGPHSGPAVDLGLCATHLKTFEERYAEHADRLREVDFK
jgi:peroxiredoxin